MNKSLPGFLQITYRDDLDVMVVRWLRQAEVPELRQGYLAILEAATAVGCRYWLLDARRRRNTDQVAQRWMLEEFLPASTAQLHGRLYICYLLAPVSLRDAEADGAFPPAIFFADKPYMGERFIDEGEAIGWLRQCQQQELLVK
ncbi:hypothetical protein [Hymenobacter jejuensis]|uniref:STAS/SEC14 domain-containing protein n=1 Tax=Hymenobacter jejuensis TaxID=2502781 RepID=A0A5B8A0M7_9BACT|nr:hypothetical protein [Hymenobacter jejuensis]QDA60225.1 hypothetical protein FHG12_08920 [Hymenobacter jejuensis]